MMETRSRLPRSFSSSDSEATERIHEYISIQERGIGDDLPYLKRDVTKSTMVIPTVLGLPARAQGKVFELIVNSDSLQQLEMEKSINWLPLSRNLVPYRTLGDGNCLAHAVSIYVWGVSDKYLTLRRLIEKCLLRKPGDLVQRWQRAQEKETKLISNYISYPQSANTNDWKTITEMAKSDKMVGRPGPLYFPLEGIHIFTLANIMARPIIVLCDNVYRMDALGAIQPCSMGGIYLPLLRSAEECERSPIVISYELGHFEPLISSEDLEIEICGHSISPDAQHCIPLQRHNLENLAVHFLTEEEEGKVKILKDEYLELSELPLCTEGYNVATQGTIMVFCAMLTFKAPPAWTIQLMKSLYCQIANDNDQINTHETSVNSWMKKPCNNHISGCLNIGEGQYNGYCSVCFRNVCLRPKPCLTPCFIGKEAEPLSTGSIKTANISQWHGKQVPKEENRETKVKCKNEGCTRARNSKFYDFCLECYTDRFVGDRIYEEFLPSTTEEVSVFKSVDCRGIKTGTNKHVIPYNLEHLALEDHLSPATSTSLIESGMKGQVPVPRTEQSITAFAALPSNDLSQRNYKVHHKNSEPKKTSACCIPQIPALQLIKDPDRSRTSSVESLCHMDNCNNNVYSEEFGLCEKCLKDQVKHQTEEEKNRSVKVLAKELSSSSALPSSYLIGPSVYAGYPSPGAIHMNQEVSPVTCTSEQESSSCCRNGKWQQFQSMGASEKTKCRVPDCLRQVQENKDGFCESCYNASVFFKSTLHPDKCTHLLCANDKYRKRDFCQSCLRQKQQGVQHGMATSIRNECTSASTIQKSTASVPQTNFQDTKCITTTCNNTGRPEYSGLCHSCFEARMEKYWSLEKAQGQKKDTRRLADEGFDFITFAGAGCSKPAQNTQNTLSDRCLPEEKATSALLCRNREAVKCKSENCSFYGSFEFNDYCSQCFFDQAMPDVLHQGDRKGLIRSRDHRAYMASSEHTNSMPGEIDNAVVGSPPKTKHCRQPGCKMFGNPARGGLCSQCAFSTHDKD